MTLLRHFDWQESPDDAASVIAVLRPENVDAAIGEIALEAVRVACNDNYLVDAWKNRRAGGPEHGALLKAALEVHLSIGFGRRSARINDDHVQGHLAEVLWHGLIPGVEAERGGRATAWMERIKPDPTEPGGDGLIVYVGIGDELSFRLWEIKKNVAGERIGQTAKVAARQLNTRGAEYLAKFVAAGTLPQAGRIGEYCARMVENWISRASHVGVGVSVGATGQQPPRQHAFRHLESQFPEFGSTQRESLLVLVPDLEKLTNAVREALWTGL